MSGVAAPGAAQVFAALSAYTTSQPWLDRALPLGVFAFNRQEAAAMGQRLAFVMDLQRLAAMPITSAWFPHLDLPGHGVQEDVPGSEQPAI